MTDSGESLRPPSASDTTCRVAIGATAVFVLAQVAADVHPAGGVLAVAVTWSLLLFVAGSGAFLWAIVVAAGRSRDEQITLAGLVWLTGAAPARVARVLRWAVIVQTVVALVTATIRPFTALAFGILAPMFGLGCLAWWAARHGAFRPIGASGGAGSPQHEQRSPRTSDAATADRPDDVVATPGPTVAADRDDRDDPDDFDQLFKRRRRRN